MQGKEQDGIHVSFGLGSLDHTYVQGTGIRVLGDLTYREGSLALEMIVLSEKMVRAELVEVNSIIDYKNATTKIAVSLMGYLLGEWLI